MVRASDDATTTCDSMTMQKLDIEANRRVGKYSRAVQVRRIAWAAAKVLFRLSPRPFFSFRSSLLRLFGAEIGRNVHIYSSANIYMPWNLRVGDWAAVGEWVLIYNLGPIVVGSKATISHRAHLCAGTHDYLDPSLPLLTPGITVCDQAWICADAFIGPGVRVGEGAVVGARAVVTKDVLPWTVVAGNPSRVIKKREMKMR